MKKILLALVATAAVAAAAAPAAAQDWRGGQDDHRAYAGGGYDQGRGSDRDVTRSVEGLRWKVNHAVQDGRISRHEARDLSMDLRQAQSLAWRVQNGQANRWEVRQLQQTLNRVEAALDGARNDNRYGRNDTYDRNDGGRGYGDQGYGRDGRY